MIKIIVRIGLILLAAGLVCGGLILYANNAGTSLGDLPGGGGAGNGAGAAGIADWNPASGTLGGAGGGVQRGRGTGAASGGSAVPQRVQNPVVAVAAEPQLGHVLSAIAPPHVSLPVWPRSLGARGLACRGRAAGRTPRCGCP